MASYLELVLIVFVCCWTFCQNTTIPLLLDNITRVNKCCEKFEILSEQLCINANDTKSGESFL